MEKDTKNLLQSATLAYKIFYGVFTWYVATKAIKRVDVAKLKQGT